jgi:hypothetical protein
MRIYRPGSPLLDELAHECLEPSAQSVSNKRLNIEFDIDVQNVSFDIAWLKTVLQRILSLAIDRSPVCGDIQITACCVGQVVEIEISDLGETPNEIATTSAFRCGNELAAGGPYIRELFASLRSRGAEFWGVACPQGGTAWTLRLPRRMTAGVTAIRAA